MSILDKHPAPWTFDDDAVKDADGHVLFSGGCIGMDNAALEIDDDVKGLILAAPELLAALKAVVAGEPGARTSAEMLIARIEGK